MKYLDPKADLTFKKIFGEHADLLISLLNALLPLKSDEQIESVEYLPTELLPEQTGRKNTIVDVLCRDICGRKFCVEMQMEWTKAFMQRVLFNASKLYVSGFEKGMPYASLKPVYSLNLVNDIIEPDMEECCHNYNIVHDRDSRKIIKGLHFTFIELPKFTPKTMPERRMAVLWLRFLTEINANTQVVPSELLESPEISKALGAVETSAFTDEEMRAYDKFWDIISTEKTLQEDSTQIGMARGIERGRAEGRVEGEESKACEIARNLLSMHLPMESIIQATGLTAEQIRNL